MLAWLASAESPPPAFWMNPPHPQPEPLDTYTAFRGEFTLEQAGEVDLRILGATWFNVWVDGRYLADGPARHPFDHPEYDAHRLKLGAGRHVVAVLVHYAGVESRIIKTQPPFLACDLRSDPGSLPVRWRSLPLSGVRSTTRRRSPLLGWMEWFDTRAMPANWQQPAFDDSAWLGIAPRDPAMGAMKAATINPVPSRFVTAREIGRGPLARYFAPDTDDPPVAFFLADLECRRVAPQGVWRRYDLGKVRIARPRFMLDLPAGAVVEFGNSEELRFGRVAPWSALSGSPTCFVDHYIARGGEQVFFPMQAQGARFFEIHVYAPTNDIRFLKEEFIERAYFDEPLGDFRCGDPLLERIWRTGIETARSSSEDAVVDSRRERGQWSGDLFVGLRIVGTSYADLRLFRRGIVQSALCAQTNGLVAALYPGQPEYIPGYAALWTPAVLDYWELTGDRTLLEEMLPYAERNLGALLAQLGPQGVTNAIGWPHGLGWNFVDWGYLPNPGPCEVVGNLQILESLRAMIRWCQELHCDATRYVAAEQQLAAAMRRYFSDELVQGGDAWKRIGYQRAVFGLRTGIIRDDEAPAAIRMIKDYIRNCFPANPRGAPLSDPYISGEFFTPYFANFALPELARHGEMEFVLQQYRDCWGWILQQGLTTWPEVFDTRWSHCHQWSGSPTWVLSRQVLGLHPRFDLGTNHFVLRVTPGGLPQAAGKVALRDGNSVEVRWRKSRDDIQYEVQSDVPIWLHLEEVTTPMPVVGRKTVRIKPQTNTRVMDRPAPYADGRPQATLRLPATDQGVVLRRGDGPNACDVLGAREASVFEQDGIYYLHYDGAGENGWQTCLATSDDLVRWTQHGVVLPRGEAGRMDSAAACSPWVIQDGDWWHLFYLGTPNVSPPPDLIPMFPYLTLKARSRSPAGPWEKQYEVIPFVTRSNTYYSATASPGQVVKHRGEYLMFFSASTHYPDVKRTLSLARTKDLNGPWRVHPTPLLPVTEQIENSSLYYERKNNTWFLFTNHIGVDAQGFEWTDAIWVYWSKDLERWDALNKAVVLDGRNCSWSKQCIGMPSVIRTGDRLAVLYDAPGGESVSHMDRNIGLAWLDLPLLPPTETRN